MGWLDNWKSADDVEFAFPTGAAELGDSVIYYSPTVKRQRFYAEILAEQVYQRSRCKWTLNEFSEQTSLDVCETSAILFLLDEKLEKKVGKEGYVLEQSFNTKGRAVIKISGCTDRAILFGVGRLLREMHLDYHVSYSKPLASQCYITSKNPMIVSKPDYAMRQHQVAYRPKTNSYDAFTPEMMKLEVIDLALFGTNAIEVIPPGVDDAMQSPNFTIPWLEMLTLVSEVCVQLDIKLSMWYPAFFKSYNTPEELREAEEHWNSIFTSLTNLDVLFVPGGDPGGRPPAELFEVIEKQAKFMRQNFFPDCEVWVSSQYGLSCSIDLGITEPWVPLVEELKWMDQLKTKKVQSFLNGVVYGPWSSLPIDEFRANVPAVLPLRNYPDLCHVQTCELPVTGWDLSFAITNNRESINPRPREMLNIIRDQAPYTIGCGCYSEGVNDDINKYVWTGLHWGDDMEGPLKGAAMEEQLDSILYQYSKFLCDQPRKADLLVKGIYGLEANWSGDLRTNHAMKCLNETTREIEVGLSPRHRKNWRLNMLLFRSYFDALLYTRLMEETDATHHVVSEIISSSTSTDDAMWNLAERNLDIPYREPTMTTSSFRSPSMRTGIDITNLSEQPTVTHLYARVYSLAALLFDQIGYQLSVGFGSQHRQRGAYFDLVWAPLGDNMYLKRVFQALQIPELDRKLIDQNLVERFITCLEEREGKSKSKVLWYASFGDEASSDLPGFISEPVRPIPLYKVLPPHREYELGEDAVLFNRPLTEFLDCSNDELYESVHDGKIPRAWRSCLTPIWPRTSKYQMRFDFDKLLPRVSSLDDLKGDEVCVRLTYVGEDLNRHGGDWEELGREGMATRMLANGKIVHGFLKPQKLTKLSTFVIPKPALERAIRSNSLVLEFEPEMPSKVTYRYVPLPIAELWILRQPAEEQLKIQSSKL